MSQVVKVVQQPTRVVSIPRAVGSPGAQGEPGTDGQPGAPGSDGAPGASAYDTWLAQGNTGSETDFLASLIGPPGEPGADGTPGRDGAPGTDGEDGPPGSDGREIALRTATGFVQWQYDGDPGWTNLIALADLTGPRGDDGADGEAGTDGVDGKSVELRVAAGYIQWRQTDGAWANLVALTAITGPPGEDGAPGAPGADGLSPDLSIGTVTTGAPGTDAAASIGGAFPDLHLDLTIPRGADGPPGTNRFLVDTGTGYPTRPDTDPVVFIGPSTPGDAMLVGDVWVDTSDDPPADVVTSVNGMTGDVTVVSMWRGTQAEYDGLGTYDPLTLYVVNG